MQFNFNTNTPAVPYSDIDAEGVEVKLMVSGADFWASPWMKDCWFWDNVSMGASQLVTRSTRHSIKSCDELTVPMMVCLFLPRVLRVTRR